MSRILCTWELGGGAGHLTHLAVLGGALRRQGHEIFFALRDLSRARGFAELTDGSLLQAPTWLRVNRRVTAANFAEILANIGYRDAAALAAHIGAWRSLMRLVRPALVVAEFSPTALIAARLEGLPRVALGTGFELPPPMSPMPTIQPWTTVDRDRLIAAEQVVLETINRAIGAEGGATLSGLSEMFDVDDRFLCTFAEFDHYGGYDGRDSDAYRGPLGMSRLSGHVPWPAGEGPRIFVYYRAAYPRFRSLVTQLASLDARTLVVADDATPALIRELQTERLHILDRRVDLEEAGRGADVAVVHGGHGSALRLVLAGCPLVMLPVVIEQALLSYRLVGQGLGLMAEARGEPDIAAMTRRVLATPGFAARAREIASRYAGFDGNAGLDAIARRCAVLAG